MSKKSRIVTKQISRAEKYSYTIQMDTDKSKVKLIKRIEQLIRTSMEYRDYIQFLREYVDMTHCAFYNNLDNSGSSRVKIEVHHHPLTLFDITKLVIDRYLDECIPINELYIADEVMQIHYNNMVGLIPLSKTLHQVVHNSSNIVLPLFMIYGNYREFVDQYGKYIEEDETISDKLQKAIDDTKMITSSSFDCLNPKFVYVDVEGFSLPQKVEVEGYQTA